MVARGWVEGAMGVSVDWVESQFGKMGKFWRQRVVMATQQLDVPNATELYT